MFGFNYSKVSSGILIWILGTINHTQRHFLDDDEFQEGTPMVLIADHMPYLIFFGGLMMCGIGYIDGKAPLHGNWTTAEICSIGVSLAALLLRIWSVRCLSHFFTFRVGIRKDHRLIREGPYSILRHPSYAGTLLFISAGSYFGGLRNGLAWGILTVISVALAGVRIFDEERVLLKAFGSECQDYFSKTWRLIPGIF